MKSCSRWAHLLVLTLCRIRRADTTYNRSVPSYRPDAESCMTDTATKEGKKSCQGCRSISLECRYSRVVAPQARARLRGGASWLLICEGWACVLDAPIDLFLVKVQT